MGYVFISYSTQNQASADNLKRYLNKNDIKTWMAPNDIPAGFEYAQVITEAIKDCSCFILLLTSAAQNSNWVPREVERAVNYGKRIIPIQLEQVDLNGDFQLYIGVNHTICMEKIEESSCEMKKLIVSIKTQGRTPRDIYRVGNVVDGKYEIIEQLEYGADYEVFISRHKNTGELYTVRAIYKDFESFSKRENSLLSVLNLNKQIDNSFHPGIVDIVDNGDHILVVMDYVDGEPLSSVIQEAGIQPEALIRKWAIELAGFLEYLHRQKPSVVNINLKPNQIILLPDGKLKMRGLVMPQEDQKDLHNKLRSNSSVFVAPEVYNNGMVDERTDIYSFGYLLYSLLTGKDFSKPPYVVLPLRKNNPDLSKAMEQIVLKCIEPNPKDRYQSAQALLKDLEHIDKIDYKLNNPSLFKIILSSFQKK